MTKLTSFFTLNLLALTALLVVPTTAQALISEPGFEVETVATGFVLPTAMTFAQDGRIFVAEKGGTVRVIENGVLLPAPVITLTDINTFGDRGLLGIAADPAFATNGYLYLSYSYENTPGANVGGEKTGRIVRITVEGSTATEASKVVLVGSVGGTVVTPSCDNYVITADCIPSDSPSHSVGGLRFGPDGKLYASLGDGAHFDFADIRSQRAQNIDSLAGKFLRINTDGTAPTDNPFYDGNPNSNRSKVFALGVRNSFRFNFHPTTGALFAGDVGWSLYEEVNHITAGSNYGWPCYEGFNKTIHNCEPSSATTTAVYTYAHDVSGAGSVTAGAFPANNAYPDQYDSSLFVGDYAQNWMKRLVIDGSNHLVSAQSFDDSPNGPVDVSTGLDGMIYYLSIYTGDLNRLTHTSGNRRPVTVIGATPTAGLLPLSVAFSSTGSVDPDGDAISYLWNFGDGATSTLANPTHVYTVGGSYSASLTVTDSNGSVAIKSVMITAGNQAPQATITSPASGALYVPGQVIQMQATATDLEDGTLSASAYHWTVILHHNTHIHIMQQFDGVTAPSFIAPDHNATDIYTEVVLMVTDSAGLTHTAVTNLYLNNGSSAGNLIANPGLEIANETSGQPLSWHQGWFGNMGVTFTYPVAGFEGSANAAEVTVTGHVEGDAKWYFDPIAVTPGQDYLFSDHYTATAPTTLFAQLALANGTYQYLDLGTLPTTAVPTQVTRTITVPAGVQSMTVFHQIGTNGTLTVDEFSLALANPPADTIFPIVSVATSSLPAFISGTTTLEVIATDNIGVAGVTLLVDDVAVGVEDTTAPYTFEWNTSTVTEGTHTIAARARDAAGNIATSSPVSVIVGTSTNLIANGNLEIVDGTVPQGWTAGTWGDHIAVFTYPVVGYNGQNAARTEITAYPFTGTGDAKWQFTKVPVTPGTEYTYSDHYRSNTISDIIGQYTLADGSFHYFGLAKEIQPTTTWASISRTFTPPATATHVNLFHLISAVGFVEIDDAVMFASGAGTPSETNAPIVAFTNPLAGQTVGGTVALTASSTDDTGVTYIFYAVDGIPITGQITTAPYLHNWNSASVADGVHTIKATTHDPFGNNSTHTISITVDNSTVTPPATTTNLIQNPSLETVGGNGDPANWFRGGWGTNNRTYTYPVAGVDGASAAKVEITTYTDGDAKWYFADVPVMPGTAYTFSEQYKSTVGTEVLARYTLAGGATQYQFLGAAPAATNWTTNTYTITPPANVISMTVFHILHSVGSLEIDAFSLTSPGAGSDTISPTTTITTPVSGATLSATANVTATATDAVGVVGVTLLVDGAAVGAEDGTTPYTFSFDTTTVTNGAHILATRARDAAGNIGTSSPVTLTVDNSTVTPPATTTNLIQNSSLETVGGNGDPANWFRGGWGTNNRTYTYPVAGVDGASAAKVEITTYTDGDAKWYFADVAVTPGTEYTFSEQYKSTTPTEVLARYTLAGGATQYQFLGALPASANWAPTTYTITPPTNTTSLTVFHILHSVGSLEIDNFQLTSGTGALDTTAPTVSVTDPINGATIANVTNITVDATDAVGVAGVTLLIDGAPVTIVDVTEDTTAPYVFSLDTAVFSNGTHTVGAQARDAAGNIATAATLTMTIANTVASPNTVLNPSLETVGLDGDPEHWFRGGWGNNIRTYTYPVVGSAGASAARVELTNHVDGDAKWRFEDIAVTPGSVYTMTHAYRSDVQTNVSVRYTLAGGGDQYISLGNRAPTPTWQNVTDTFVIPANAVSMTVMHIVYTNGWLEIDDYSITSGNSNAFAQGMISYTFDDGWRSHYTDALPILNAGNTKGTFYVVSEFTNTLPTELIANNSVETTGGTGTPTDWFQGGWGTNDRVYTYPVIGTDGGSAAKVEITSYTDGDAKWYFADVAVAPTTQYVFSDHYSSNVPSEVLVRYTLSGGAVQYVGLATLPATADSWQNVTYTIITPADAVSMTVFHLIHGVGYVTVDNFSLKAVRSSISPEEVLALQAAGHEIGGHSRTHPALTTLTPTDAQFEITGSRNEILAMGVTSVESFAYPFGDYNPAVQGMTQTAGYVSARGVDRGYNTTVTDKRALKIQRVGRETTMADIQTWTAQAIADKTWLILMFHQIDGDLAADLGATPAFLTDIVNYVNTTSISKVTVKEGVALMTP